LFNLVIVFRVINETSKRNFFIAKSFTINFVGLLVTILRKTVR